ncbi:MAG: hypothetical protein WB809_02750 [Thermoplasmata archaeon]
MSAPAADELLPGGLRRPTSVFVVGPNDLLVNWVTVALLAPYPSRLYWTAVQLPGEKFGSLDPLGRGIIPADRVDVVNPNELRREESAGRQAEVAAATVLRADEPPEYVRRLTEFLRLPSHSQRLLASTTSGPEVPILVASNAQRLMSLFPNPSIGPTVQAFLDTGATLVLLWAGTPPARRKIFDIVLHVDGNEVLRWREATLWCEQGIATGPLSSGKRPRLAELPSIAKFLETALPPADGVSSDRGR